MTRICRRGTARAALESDMPTYEWECTRKRPRCGKHRDVICTVAARNEPQVCECGKPMVRTITASMVMPDIRPYVAVAGDRAGKPIGGRAEHREFLKRNRLIEIGDAPVRDTRAMRKIHRRGEIREELKRVVPEALRRGQKRY